MSPDNRLTKVDVIDQITVVCLDRASCIIRLTSASADATMNLMRSVEKYDEAITTLAGVLTDLEARQEAR